MPSCSQRSEGEYSVGEYVDGEYVGGELKDGGSVSANPVSVLATLSSSGSTTVGVAGEAVDGASDAVLLTAALSMAESFIA